MWRHCRLSLRRWVPIPSQRHCRQIRTRSTVGCLRPVERPNVAQVPYDQGIPFASPAPTPPQDYQHVEATPASFGSEIAQGEAKAGEGAITAVKFYSQIAAQQAVSDWEGKASQTLSDFKKLRGQDAMTAQPDALAALSDAEKEGAESLPTADAQLNFTQNIRSLRALYERDIGTLYDQ